MFLNLLPTRDGHYHEHLQHAEPKNDSAQTIAKQALQTRLFALSSLALLVILSLVYPNALAAWLLLHLVPGLGMVLLLPRMRCGPLGSESIVHSYVATPVLLYLLRIFGLGNSFLVPVVLAAPLACALSFSRSSLVAVLRRENRSSNETTADYWLVSFLMFAAAFPVAVAMLPIIAGSNIAGNIGDLPKHAAAVFGTLHSSGLSIDNPFVPNAKMVYYFFYYFKVGAFANLASLQSPTGIQFGLFVESLVTLYVFLYLAVRTARALGATTLVVCVAASIFVLDGGWDVPLAYLRAMPLAEGGHVEYFIRSYFGPLAVTTTAYVGFITKHLWVPQHVAAMAVFLFAVRLLVPISDLRPKDVGAPRPFGFADAVTLAIALLASIGYSVFVAVGTFLAVAVILLPTCFKWAKQKDWNAFGWPVVGGALYVVLAIPLLQSYAGSSGSLDNRRLNEFFKKFDYDSTIAVLAPLTEFGALSLLIGVGLALAVFRKKITSAQRVLLACYGALFVALMTMRTDAFINDFGMHVYSLMGVVALLLACTFDLNALLMHRVFITLLLIAVAPGLWTNLNELRFHADPCPINASLMWEAGHYVHEHAEAEDRVTFLSGANDLAPMLTGRGTCPPSVAAYVYLTPEARNEMWSWLQQLHRYQEHPVLQGANIAEFLPLEMRVAPDPSRNSAEAEEEDLKRIVRIFEEAGVRWMLCSDTSSAYKSVDQYGESAGLDLVFQNKDWRVYRIRSKEERSLDKT